MKEFQQIEWDANLANACRRLVLLALEEDLEDQQDWTSVTLVPEDRTAAADIVAREAGVAAGLAAIETILDVAMVSLEYECHFTDGQPFPARAKLATIRGNARELLTLERTLLNLLGRMMGIATLTAQFVAEVQGTRARVYDTRKTTPGWRRLEKYAVRCGGGTNHRLGLFDAVLIKDNHLAQRAGLAQAGPQDAADAVREVRSFFETYPSWSSEEPLIVEVEVESLAQLSAVIPAGPDIVLLDNMSLESLREAVQIRDSLAPQIQLEASGGVRLDTLRKIALTGVDRISAGALTHSARTLDIGLDWLGR